MQVGLVRPRGEAARQVPDRALRPWLDHVLVRSLPVGIVHDDQDVGEPRHAVARALGLEVRLERALPGLATRPDELGIGDEVAVHLEAAEPFVEEREVGIAGQDRVGFAGEPLRTAPGKQLREQVAELHPSLLSPKNAQHREPVPERRYYARCRDTSRAASPGRPHDRAPTLPGTATDRPTSPPT